MRVKMQIKPYDGTLDFYFKIMHSTLFIWKMRV